MTVRVLIENNFQIDGVEIRIGRKTENGLLVMMDGGTHADLIANGVSLPIAPFATVTDDVAMALRDALTVHYGGAPETKWLRADYDAERKRVDTLTEAIISRLRSPI